MTNKRTSNGKAKAKYRDLSTAAAKCAAFGRDDVCQEGRKRQATAKTEADPYGMTTREAMTTARVRVMSNAKGNVGFSPR